MQFAVVLEMFSWRQAVIQPGVLRQDAYGGTHLLRLTQQIIARDRSGSTGWFQQSAEKAHGGCLPSTVRAKKAKDFTVAHFEAHLVDRGESSKPLSQ